METKRSVSTAPWKEGSRTPSLGVGSFRLCTGGRPPEWVLGGRSGRACGLLLVAGGTGATRPQVLSVQLSLKPLIGQVSLKRKTISKEIDKCEKKEINSRKICRIMLFGRK